MDEYQSLSHTKWECKYHVVFIPKYRKKNIYGGVRTELGPILRELAKQTDDRVWSKVAHQTRTSSISKLKVSGGKRRGGTERGGCSRHLAVLTRLRAVLGKAL